MRQDNRSPFIRTGVLAAAVTLVLAGCSGADPGDGDAGSEDFTFSYAVTDSGIEPPYRALAEAYMKENPDVEIIFSEVSNDSYGQTITTQLNAGNAADVFQVAPGLGRTYSVVPLAEAELLAPLGDAATESIPSGSEAQFQSDGETYAVALGLTFASVVLNSTTAKSDGFSYPDDWSGLLSSCQDVEADGKSVFVLAGAAPPNAGLMALALSATRVYAENPNWNEDRAAGETRFADSQGWKDTLQAIVDLNEAGCLQKGVEGAGFDALSPGMIQGTSFAAFAPSGAAADFKQAAPDQDFIVQALPPESGDDAFGLAGADYALSLNAKSDNVEAAEKFIEWSAGAEGQKVFADAAGSLPVGEDLSDTVFAPVADIVESGDFVPRPNSSWANPAVFEALGTGVQGLLTGQKSVDQVLNDMDTAWG